MHEDNPLETTTLQYGDGTTTLTTLSNLGTSIVEIRELTPFDMFSRKLGEDMDYAWSWQCNLAMMIYDASDAISHRIANISAAQFMNNTFNVDVTKTDMWKKFESEWLVDTIIDEDLIEIIQCRSNGSVRILPLNLTIDKAHADVLVVGLDGEIELDVLEAIMEHCRRQIKKAYGLTRTIDDVLELHSKGAIESKHTYSLDGTSPGKGGRVWVDDSEFSLLSLNALLKQMYQELSKQPLEELSTLMAHRKDLAE